MAHITNKELTIRQIGEFKTSRGIEDHVGADQRKKGEA